MFSFGSVSQIWRRAGALLLAVQLASLAHAQEQPYYDEVFAEDGSIRPEYASIWGDLQNLSEAEIATFRKRTNKDFLGDNPLGEIPRLISESDNNLVRRGVAQRAMALRLFLRDYYSGKRTFDQYVDPETGEKGVFPKGVLEDVVARAGETGFMGLVKPDAISFNYGPDVIRGPGASRFYVLEDNPGTVGSIGGFGDLVKARESYFKNMPRAREKLEILGDSEAFYRDMVDGFRKAMPSPDLKIVYAAISLGEQADKEDVRVRKLLEKNGVTVVTPNTDQAIVVEADGVYLTKRGGMTPREKVGFVIFGHDPKNVDPGHPVYAELVLKESVASHIASYRDALRTMATIEREAAQKPEAERAVFKRTRLMELIPDKDARTDYLYLRDKGAPALEASVKHLSEALSRFDSLPKEQAMQGLDEALRTHSQFAYKSPTKSKYPGLVAAVLDGRVAANLTPGVEFIGDKIFYLHVPKLIRHYLKQEPVIHNVNGGSFAKEQGGELVLDEATLASKLANVKQFVIKGADGRGGDAVWVGPYVKEEQKGNLEELIRRDPAKYGWWDFVHLSVLGNYLVDSRYLSWVGPDGEVRVAYTPWGRGVPFRDRQGRSVGDGKVNISASGVEMAVFPVPERFANPCALVRNAANRPGALGSVPK